jgi:hypothetical protein
MTPQGMANLIAELLRAVEPNIRQGVDNQGCDTIYVSKDGQHFRISVRRQRAAQ